MSGLHSTSSHLKLSLGNKKSQVIIKTEVQHNLKAPIIASKLDQRAMDP